MHSAQLMPKHNAQLPVMQPAYAVQMAKDTPRKARRRENLALLIQEIGSPTELSVLVGTPKSHISAIQAGNRGIGDELAAKLERITGKAPGWMDEDHGDPVMTDDAMLVDGLNVLKRINPETHTKLTAQLMNIVRGAIEADNLIRSNTSADYVLPERAHELLGKRIVEVKATKEASPTELRELKVLAEELLKSLANQLQGISPIDDAPNESETLLGGSSGFGELQDDLPEPRSSGRRSKS